MSRYAFLYPFLLTLIFFNAGAQQPWTLQQCIDYALDHNITIKQSELNVELNQALTDQSTANLFPTLNGFASHNYYYGRSIDPNTNLFTNNQIRSNSFSLNSSVALFEGFQLQNELKQSKLNYMASKYDLLKVRNDISLNVVTAYLQVLYNKDLSQTTQEQRDATKVQTDRTRRMEELGSVSKGNRLDIESQLAADEVRLITAKAQYDQALLTLRQLMELDTAKDFNIVQPELAVPQMNNTYSDANAIYLAALSNQPDMISYVYKIESAEKGLTIAKGGAYPRLSLVGSLSTAYNSTNETVTGYQLGSPQVVGYTSDSATVYSQFLNPVLQKTSFSDQWNNNFGKSIGLSLNIPIFNNWNTHTGIRRARINLRQTQLSYDATRKGLYKSIQQAVQDAVAGYQKYDAGLKSVSAQQEAMNFNQQKYEVGLISTYDFLLAKNNLALAQANLLQAKYDYIFRLKVLDFYMGKTLTF